MNALISNLYTSPAPGETEATLAVSTSPVSFDLSTFGDDTKYFDVQVQGAAVRVRFDGTAPDTSTGFILPDAFSATWSRARLKAAKFIRDDSTDATVRIGPVAY